MTLDLGADAGANAARALVEAAVHHIGDVVGRPLLEATDSAWTGDVSDAQMRIERGVLGPDLYEGLAGLAVFFAQLAEWTGDERHERLARSATARVRTQTGGDILARLPLGLEGLAGLAFGAMTTTLAVDSDDADAVLASAATHLVGRAGRGAAPSGFDLIAGEAGALLALVALIEADLVDGADLAAAATRYADVLLAGQQRTGPAGGAWLLFDEACPIVGTGHGTSGIIWALHRAKVVLGHRVDAIDDAIGRALAYEDDVFDATLGNWIDPRRPDARDQLNAWCYGAAGVRLVRARLALPVPPGCVEPGDDDTPPVDHLCCGVAGRLEAALATGTAGTAGTAEDTGTWSAEIVAMTSALAQRVLDDSTRLDHPRSPTDGADRGASTGYFRGLPGIGAALLHFLQADRRSSVLLLT